MAKRFWRKLAILAKVETTYGTDAVPTGAANAMQMTEVSLTPLAGEEVSRDLMLAHFGHQGVMLVGDYVELQGSVEIAGSGTAGTAPAYGPLLRACGMSEVLAVGVSATYQPVSAGQEGVSIYANLDGVNHKLLGARGTLTFGFTPKQIPRFTFTLRGLLGAIADTALPTAVLTGFKAPVPVSKTNTPVLTLHGYSAIGESLSIDVANSVESRNLIGEDSIQITNRQSTGSLVVEAGSIAAKDWFAIARAHTKDALALQHGTVAGNIVDVLASKVQIGRPTYGQTQGITNLTLPLMLTPNLGDDELSIVVR